MVISRKPTEALENSEVSTPCSGLVLIPHCETTIVSRFPRANANSVQSTDELTWTLLTERYGATAESVHTEGKEKSPDERKKLIELNCFCRFEGGLRSAANARSNSAFVLDYDKGTVSFDRAIAVLRSQGLAALVYETPTATPSLHKWRVVIPLGTHWEGTAEQWKLQYNALRTQLFEPLFGVEEFDSKTSARGHGFFVPIRMTEDDLPRRVQWIEGLGLDFDATAKNYPVETKPTPLLQPTIVSPLRADQIDRKRAVGYLNSLLSKIASAQQRYRHETQLFLGNTLFGRVPTGELTDEEVTSGLLEAGLANGRPLNEVETDIKSSRGWGTARPLPPLADGDEYRVSAQWIVAYCRQLKGQFSTGQIRTALTTVKDDLAALPADERGDIKEDIVRALNRKVQKPRDFVEEVLAMPTVISADEGWPDPVDGVDLYADLRAYFDLHLRLPTGSIDVLVLWVLHTHLLHRFRHTPRLIFSSPDKSCGKSRALELLRFVCKSPFSANDTTKAVLFRIIEKRQPTVFFDEADRSSASEAWFGITTILNHGFEEGATVPRCAESRDQKGQFEIEEYHVFAPAVFAGINASERIDSTLVSRSIVIQMQRKAPDDFVEPFRKRDQDRFIPLRQKIIRWCRDHEDQIDPSEIARVEGADDREADVWESLQAVAKAIQPSIWESLCNDSFRAIKGTTRRMSEYERLLRDIYPVALEARQRQSGEITLTRLVEALTSEQGGYWTEAWHGRCITPNWLARQLASSGLKTYRKTISRLEKSARAYRVKDLLKECIRYVPSLETSAEGGLE